MEVLQLLNGLGSKEVREVGGRVWALQSAVRAEDGGLTAITAHSPRLPHGVPVEGLPLPVGFGGLQGRQQRLRFGVPGIKLTESTFLYNVDKGGVVRMRLTLLVSDKVVFYVEEVVRLALIVVRSPHSHKSEFVSQTGDLLQGTGSYRLGQ